MKIVQSAKLSIENPRNFGEQYDSDLSFQHMLQGTVPRVHIKVPVPLHILPTQKHLQHFLKNAGYLL